MNYYRYDPNADHFAGIGFSSADDEQVVGVHDTDKRLVGTWRVPHAHEFDDNPPTRGDFPSLSNFNEIPVMSRRAWEALRPLIGYCCEALPITHPTGERYFIIHVMETIDALDEAQSKVKRYTDGAIMRVVQYAFKHEMLAGKHIFKLPQESGGELLVDDEFRKAVESNGLKGLLFTAVPLASEACSETSKRTDQGATISESATDKVARHRTLTDEESREIQEQIEHAGQVLGIDPCSVAPDDIQRCIYEEINRVRLHEDVSQVLDAFASHGRQTLENIALGLGCLWGQSLCDRLGWRWAFITVDDVEGVGIISPTQSLVAFPLSYVNELITDTNREHTSLLLYNMLKDDAVSAAQDSYTVVG